MKASYLSDNSTPAAYFSGLLILLAYTSIWRHPAILTGVIVTLLVCAAMDGVIKSTLWNMLRLMITGFILVAPLPFLIPGKELFRFGILTVTDVGLHRAGLVLLRLGVSAAGLSWLNSKIPATNLVEALYFFRLPAVFIAIIGFILRYGAVLNDESRRMRLARQARAGHPKGKWQRLAAASIIGVLLSRTQQRSQRVYLAMLARGQGRLDASAPPIHLTSTQWLTLAATAIVGLTFTFIDIALQG